MSDSLIPSNKETHFKVVIQAYNASKWIIDCLKSVVIQKYENWQAIIHIEPSEDGTYESVSQYLDSIADPRFVLRKNEIRRLRPTNDLEAIKIANPNNEDVVMFLDGDDKLYDDKVFSCLNAVYQDDDIWITWGSYILKHNNEIGGAACEVPPPKYDPYAGKRRWRYSHLKTFRYFLFKGIKHKDLLEKRTGEYYPVAWDMALMFPMIEMAGKEHSQYINKILYVYNLSTPYNNEKVNVFHCLDCAAEVTSRPQYKQKTKESLCSL